MRKTLVRNYYRENISRRSVRYISEFIGILGSICLCAVSSSIAQDRDVNQSKRPSLMPVAPTGYKPLPVTDESVAGEREFKLLNCKVCHSIRGAGGRYGPALDAVGHQRNQDYLQARLENSAQARDRFAQLTGRDRQSDIHVRLRPQTAKRLVAYLLTLPDPPGGFVIVPHAVRLPAEPEVPNMQFHPVQSTESSREGEKLYNKYGCAACHAIENAGGWLGPQLDGVAGRHRREYIIAHISDSQVHVGQKLEGDLVAETHMPITNASPEEIQKIAEYLETLPNLPSQKTH